MMSLKRAREIAAAWHGGQWSYLYSFASSGVIQHPFLLQEIGRELLKAKASGVYTKKDIAELTSLQQSIDTIVTKQLGYHR